MNISGKKIDTMANVSNLAGNPMFVVIYQGFYIFLFFHLVIFHGCVLIFFSVLTVYWTCKLCWSNTNIWLLQVQLQHDCPLFIKIYQMNGIAHWSCPMNEPNILPCILVDLSWVFTLQMKKYETCVTTGMSVHSSQNMCWKERRWCIK